MANHLVVHTPHCLYGEELIFLLTFKLIAVVDLTMCVLHVRRITLTPIMFPLAQSSAKFVILKAVLKLSEGHGPKRCNRVVLDNVLFAIYSLHIIQRCSSVMPPPL